ncbi:hypothetical protein [Nonomuraea recticatena]|uniref:hypothetical protein n=1 Tax=Nonomuraea recticatena TaxID=46178 RepID=UPI00361D5F11
MSRQGASVQEFLRRYTASPEASMTDAYLWLIALSLGYVAALYPLLALLRLRKEELEGRAELLLATPVSRLRWAGGHLFLALAGSALILAVAGLTLGLAAGDPLGVLGGTLVQIPAVWVLAGVGVLAFGLLPRAAAGISWAAFLFVNLFGEVLGPIMGIDYWIAKYVVPFPNLPMVLSGEEFGAGPPGHDRDHDRLLGRGAHRAEAQGARLRSGDGGTGGATLSRRTGVRGEALVAAGGQDVVDLLQAVLHLRPA